MPASPDEIRPVTPGEEVVGGTLEHMAFDLYVWSEPRDLDADAAEALVRTWQAAGGDPAASPFEPSGT